MGLRVKDAAQTVTRATAFGTASFHQPVGIGELEIPAVQGVGGNIVHFIDENSELHRVWDIEFRPVSKTEATPPAGLRRIDHVAQTMSHDEMQSWLLTYITLFEMEKSAILDVHDPSGVVRSQALESPEGEVRLNLNGAYNTQTLAGSFVAERMGAGVQHIALLTDDIMETAQQLQRSDFPRLPIPPSYYAETQALFGLSDALTEQLRQNDLLYDEDEAGAYFQLYSQPIFNGFFFEIVQRRDGYNGYGARNAAVRLSAQASLLNTTGGLRKAS
jgi:4-hydroxyphenylpyruvate dioxygenase